MDTKLKQLVRGNGGPLSTEQLQTLRDMQGWIEYAIANGFTMKSTLGVLAHDVNGILADVPALKPQVSGYGKYRAEVDDLSALADEPNPNDS